MIRFEKKYFFRFLLIGYFQSKKVMKLDKKKVQVEKPAKDSASSLSTNKTFILLEYLAQAKTTVRLQDISEDIGMTQSSVLRYLTSLINNNYAYQDEETLKYGLTWKIKRLGHNLNSHLNMRAIVSPFLNQLARDLGVGASLATEVEFRAVYIDFIDKPGKKLSLRRIGVDAPIHATASGKLMLSKYSDSEIADYAKITGLEKLTETTITKIPDLIHEIEKVRKQGYALDNEECEVNNFCVSVPLYDYTDKIYAGMSVFDTADNMTEKRIQEVILPKLREMQKIISTRLGSSRFIE